MLTDTASNNASLLGLSLKLSTHGTNSVLSMSSCLWRQASLTSEDPQQQMRNLAESVGNLNSLLCGLF